MNPLLSLSDSASDWINKLINRDGQFRDISIKTNYNFGDVAGVSGFSDFDYTASNLHVGGELEFEKCTALPSELLEKFAGLRQCCCMGVFPNCGKAWLTVDNEFFIWNFDDGEDLAFYDGCEDVIISVSLLRPKQGILPPQIEYLLGLATSIELLLLGVTYDFSTSTDDRVNPGVLQVLPTPLYRLPSENHRITCMESTSDGRLFLGDAKGDLLEFTYDSIPGLEIGFELPSSGPCNLKNHSSSSLSFLLPSIFTVGFCPSGALTQLAVDSSRGLLYTLSANSNLALYQYADPHGKSSSGCLTKLASLSGSDLASRAASVVRSFDKQAFSRLVGLFCLTGEGPIQAMAVTHTGVRIYFSNNLRIAHIRLPPRTQASFDYENGVPKNVMASFCLGEVKLVAETRGTLIIASTVSKPTGAGSSASTGAASSEQSFCGPQPLTATQEAQVASDGQNLVLSIISPDTYPWSTSLTEAYATSLPILSPWAITVLSCDDDTASSSTPSLPPEATSGVSKSSFNRRGIDLPHEMSSLSPEEQQTQQPQLRARGPPPVVLTQHLDPPYRRVLVISADGITHLRLPSPLQRLREFLLSHLGTTLSSSLMGGGVAPGGFDGGGDALNTTATSFLPNFLHQFGPDESMCAAFSIAADAYRTCLDDSTQTSGFGGLVEQAERVAMFFAAESTRLWQPPVSRESLTSIIPRSGPAIVGSLAAATAAAEELETSTAGTFLLIGASLFLSRVARAVWRAPMLTIADRSSAASGTAAATGVPTWTRAVSGSGSGGLRSFLYTLVSTAIYKASAKSADQETCLITSRLSTEDLGWILHQLHYLKDFLSRQLTSRNSWLRSGTTTLATLPSGKLWSPPDIRASAGSGLCRLAQDLLSLVSAFIEFVGLWQIVSQHPVPSIVRRLTPDQRADLLSLPVEAFVCWMPPAAFPPSLPSPAVARDASIFCSPSLRQQQYQQTGQGQPQLSSPSPPPPPPPPPRTNVQDLRSSLITALMEHYLSADEPHEATTGTPASVDALSARLRAVCPNLFANEDALCAKAEELLVRACAAATAAVGGPATAENALPPPLPPTVDQLVLEAAELFAEAGPSINVGLAAQRLLNSVGAWQVAASLCLSVAQNRDPTDIAVTCLREGRMPSPLADGQRASELAVVESRYDAYRHLLNCLDRLLVAAALPAAASEIPESPSSPSSTQSSQLALGPNPSASAARTCLLTILKSIVKSEDTLAHFEVIGWLLSNGLIEQVVTLNSTHLEAYLRSRLRQTPNDVSLRCLLWRQLEARGAHLEAARVLEHLASAPSGGLELEDRLDYLARAIITVKALPPNQQDPDYLCDLQDRLETAELQRQLCVELAAFGCPDQQKHCKGVETTGLEEAIHELTHGPLLSLSDLFTRYADPFDLHESKLLLLRFAGEADSDLVRAIWLALLHRLLVSAPESQSSPANRSSRSPRQRLAEGSVRRSELTLSTALFRLYTRLAAPAGPTLAVDYSFFPLPVIISTLERYAIQLSLPATWVSCVLSSARIPPSAEIVEAYNIILCDKDPFWRGEEVRVRLLEAIQTVVSDFLAIADSLHPRQRQLQASRMLDHLTTHLVEMHSEPSRAYAAVTDSGRTGAAAVEKLQFLRAQLDRLVAQ